MPDVTQSTRNSHTGAVHYSIMKQDTECSGGFAWVHAQYVLAAELQWHTPLPRRLSHKCRIYRMGPSRLWIFIMMAALVTHSHWRGQSRGSMSAAWQATLCRC